MAAVPAEICEEHLSSPQQFSLRPSAAAENLCALVNEARALHHDYARTGQGTSASNSDARYSRSANSTSPDPASRRKADEITPTSRSAPAPLMLTNLLQPLQPPSEIAPRVPSPPPALVSSASPRSKRERAQSPSAARGGRASQITSTRKHQPSRAAHRSASPRAQKSSDTPPPSRPNSLGGYSSRLSLSGDKIITKHDELPQQLAISPRRDQSALVSQMIVSESGGSLAGGSVRAFLEVRGLAIIHISHAH